MRKIAHSQQSVRSNAELAQMVAQIAQIVAPDPSLPGSFDVGAGRDGAGENKRRPECGVERDLESRTVTALRT